MHTMTRVVLVLEFDCIKRKEQRLQWEFLLRLLTKVLIVQVYKIMVCCWSQSINIAAMSLLLAYFYGELQLQVHNASSAISKSPINTTNSIELNAKSTIDSVT